MSYVQPAAAGRRSVGLIVVLVFHAVLFYALVNGLGRKVVEVLKEPLEAKIIEEIKPPPEDKPPPPPPKLSKAAPPPVFVPAAEVRVQQQPTPSETITPTTSVKPTEVTPIGAKVAPVAHEPAPAAPPAHTKTAAVVDSKRCTKPEYPAASLRAEETGTVRLLFLIGVDGRAVDSKVERSSGSRRLDEAARRALLDCHFKPATVNGQPIQDWARIEYEWKIEE